jgi:pimeloyl-ACP methyl ester carboxylesterase
LADLNGLHYDVTGSGPAVVLLHAGIADSRMWAPQVEALEGDYTVVRLDFRGFGRSEVPSGPFSPGRDVVDLLDALSLERAALVGVSMGGGIALQVAVARPDRLWALALVGAGLRDHPWSPEVRRAWEEEEDALERGDLDAAVEVNLRTWVDGPGREPHEVDPGVRDLVAGMQRRAFELERPDGGPEEELEESAAARLAEIRVPTLVLVGALDVPDMLAISERIAAEVPGAERVVVDGGAHMVTMERPDQVNEPLLAFLAQSSRVTA